MINSHQRSCPCEHSQQKGIKGINAVVVEEFITLPNGEDIVTACSVSGKTWFWLNDWTFVGVEGIKINDEVSWGLLR